MVPWVWVGCAPGDGPLAPIRVEAIPLRSGLGDRLASVAAFTLDAADSRWGGWSGAALDGDVLSAVSDVGGWLQLRLVAGADGRLTDVVPLGRGTLVDELGEPLTAKSVADAEGLARGAGTWVVSFERDHRLLQYPSLDGGHPARLALPSDFHAPPNAGIEAVAWADDRWWLIVEGEEDEGGPYPGWMGRPGAWERFSVPRTDGFRPVELTPLPDGALLLIERRYQKSADEVSIRVSSFAPAAVTPGAVVAPVVLGVLGPDGPPMDNYEAAATDGRFLYLLADDNLAADQRTLLLQVEIRP